MQQQLRPLFLRHQQCIAKDTPILDLGCGISEDLFILAKQGYQIDAVDKSPEIVSKLQKRCEQEKIKNIDFKQEEINKYPFSKQYGTIIAMHVLHFLTVQERKKLIEQMQQHTVPKGVHFIAVFTKKGDMEPGKIVHFFDDKELLSYYKGWNVLSYNLAMKPIMEKDKEGKPKQHEIAFLAVQKP